MFFLKMFSCPEYHVTLHINLFIYILLTKPCTLHQTQLIAVNRQNKAYPNEIYSVLK